jgi:multidrug efflux pump
MNFTDIFIRRPVFATALSLLLLVVGIAAFSKMPIRQYPKIDVSTISVTTIYAGASADLMSGFVTTPMENAIGSVDGIDYMVSKNTQSTSSITINLQLGYPMEKAITDVANQIQSIRWQLPKDVQDPVIQKYDPNAQPILYIAFKSNDMSPEGITDYLLRVVQPQMETLNGVSAAKILGEREYAMRINLDPQQMAAHNVTANDVFMALSANNLQTAAGKVEGDLQTFNVTANTDMSSPEQFNKMAIKTVGNKIIRLGDVGEAILGAKDYESSAYMDGRKTTVIGIIPTSDANPLDVAKAVKKVLPGIQQALPPGLTAEITYDSTLFINASIHEVYVTILLAVIFVSIVIFLFLGSVRAVMIPLVTIPLSLIGVCGVMLALNFTINTLTLLAWVLAIGLVVDDAIVVLENIHRHMEEGVEPIPAAIIGAREIGFAIIAMTITLAAVYAPIGFTGGLTGILFTEFAFTLAASVIISGFVALTLSPMMCSRILTVKAMHAPFPQMIDRLFHKIMVFYKGLLRKVLQRKWWVVAIAVVLYLLFYGLIKTTRAELAPMEDQGIILTYIEGPSSSNIKFTEKYTDMINPIYQALPELWHYGIINGFPTNVNQAVSFITLVDWNKRKRSSQEVSYSLVPQLSAIPGLMISPFNPPPLPGSQGLAQLEFVVKDPMGIEELEPVMQALMMAARQNPGFTFVTTDLKLDKPQVNLEIDRNKAGDLGVTMAEISSALNTMFGEPTNLRFSRKGRSYYVIPELKGNFDFIANPKDINTIYVHSQSGKLVPLSNFITVKELIEPQSINHFQQLPSATLVGNLAPWYTVGQALNFLENFIQKNYPMVQYDFSGQSRQYIQAQGAMTMVMFFAVIFIFLVLAAQFESYRDPLIILCVVPLTLAGALLTLRLTGGTLNIYSQIGLVTLVGLIAKHGILIVEFSNQLQLKGYSQLDAVVEATSLRLRPILMTTAAMVLGVFPLAIASGAGAVARNMLGWTIVGGMTIGTLFSLFVVPAFYLIMAKVKKTDEALNTQIEQAIERAKQTKTE